MSQAPSRNKQKRKEESENIFLEILHNIIIQFPVMLIGWIISKFDWD